MNKLLISLLSLTGIAGISTGGYFLLRGNSVEGNSEKETKKSDNRDSEKGQTNEGNQASGGGAGTGVPEAQRESTVQNGGESAGGVGTSSV